MRRLAATWPTTPISRTGLRPGMRTRRRFGIAPRPICSTKKSFRIEVYDYASDFKKGISKDSLRLGAGAHYGTALRVDGQSLGLPVGLQLYSVRDLLPKDYEGTLQQLGAMASRSGGCGLFRHSSSEVKQAMFAWIELCERALSAEDLLPKVDEVIQFGKIWGSNTSSARRRG